MILLFRNLIYAATGLAGLKIIDGTENNCFEAGAGPDIGLRRSSNSKCTPSLGRRINSPLGRI